MSTPSKIKALIGFKSDLGRFCRTYSYIAQLIDFGDPELENFAAFAKLLQSVYCTKHLKPWT
ncbi:putative type III restriction enzyme, res subunit [Klebsiella pneumoniae]|uniref:Putative type III restriction enzyme, res subunit n=1 Tax=Klebsiella pneumoniae TaxID=573 RepID=A0A2X3EGZ0_KLEPN|nr:putative type III restriction enzyme, res subunit [Klebsiella pneumoniae]